MRFGLSVLMCGLCLPLSALADEAGQWTEQLRKTDRYARVLTAEAWQHSFEDDPSNVTHAVIGPDLSVGYIRIKTFDPSTTCRDVRLAILKLHKANVRTLQLDLRKNPGGQRMMAVCVAGLFVGVRPIVRLQNVPSLLPNLSELVANPVNPSDQKIFWLRSITSQETHLPLTVLIDSYTASASEIVAGALQYYKRAKIAGESRSYGKGMAQECTEMRGRPDLMICYTVQKFFLPDGHSPEGRGIKPSILRPLLP